MAAEGTRPAPIWLADWSDSEDEDFRAAFAAAGVEARVLRGPPLGRSVGTRLHRVRSWPAYTSLTVRGLRTAGGAPVVAWQPIAGALAALLRRGGRPPLVLLNPLLDPGAASLRQRIVLAGAARADRIVFFSSRALEVGAALGLSRPRLRFVPLGIRAAPDWRPPAGDYLLAVGRESRDWQTLARAAQGLPCEVVVVGPSSLPESRPLRLVPQRDRRRLLELVDGARALVVPLLRAERSAGQLAILDAISVGRAVVATRAQGTEDYVSAETGFLVPPGDSEALHEALLCVHALPVAEAMGRAAHAAARGPLSLERFVAAVDAQARSI
jgi:glycosyltransferase involved in cell wall biosynthesis